MSGEEADLSDAMKESPTSPFEESEPEMLTSSGVALPRNALLTSSRVTSSPEGLLTSSGVASSALASSRDAVVTLSADGLMTSSQESSSTSQR